MNKINQIPLVTSEFFGQISPRFQKNRIVLIALAALALLVITITWFMRRPTPQLHLPQPAPARQIIAQNPTKEALLKVNLPAPNKQPDLIVDAPKPKPSTVVKVDKELIKRILNMVQEEKYSNIVSLIKQENLPKQQEVFEPLFQSISAHINNNTSQLVHLRYKCMCINFMLEIFSNSMEFPTNIFDKHNMALNRNAPFGQKDNVETLQKLTLEHLSHIIKMLAIDKPTKCSTLIDVAKRLYFTSHESIASFYESQVIISKCDKHLEDFREYSNQLKNLVHQFDKVVEKIAHLDVEGLEQQLLENNPMAKFS